MKVKVLSRNPDHYLRETKHDIHKLPRNYDPALHPFQGPREYVRALNAAKLERVFSKPFLGSLDGHKDGISVLAKHPERLSWLYSGAFDGEIKVWDLPRRKCLFSIPAHEGAVKSIGFAADCQSFFTAGSDKTIKQWKSEPSELEDSSEPLTTVVSKTVLTALSHSYKKPMFATSGEVCQIWEDTRATPLCSLSWGIDTLHNVRFNPVHVDVLAACGSDRSIIIYDVREANPIRKVILDMKSNALAWNPMEAYHFTVANEDYNLYTFDMRSLSLPLLMHMDHVSAVMDVDYSPTGQEFVSGSYDKTIRIFPVDKGRSREVYHTKRMQRLTSVMWSMDNKYILSGSDEMNIRLWKARAAEKLGIVSHREQASLNYSSRLKDRFGNHPQVRRVLHHRHVPKHIHHSRQEHATIRRKQKIKDARRRTHSKPGTIPHRSEKSKHVIAETE